MCRFNFPKLLCGYRWEYINRAESEAQRLARLESVLADGGIFEPPEIVFARNHAFLVTHIPELLSLWRGNVDMKLVHNIQQLEKYLTKYIMKPEKKSVSFQDIAKTVAQRPLF